MVRKQRKRISYVLPLANSAGGHRLGVNGLAIDQDNAILYTGGRDGVICAWDLNLKLNGPTSSPFDSALNAPATSSPLYLSSSISHGSNSSYGNSFTRGASPHSARTPSNAAPPTTLRHQVQAHTHWINDIALVHDNEALVSASSDISVKLWRPTAHASTPPQTIGLHSDYVKCLASPGSGVDWVASGGLDRKVRLWDLRGGGEVLNINVGEDENAGNKGSVYALAATGSLVAGGGPESIVRVWDARSGTRVTKFVGHTDNIRAVLISRDGETVISASSDQTVKVWSMSAGRCMHTLTMHTDSVWSLYSDDARLEVFWSSDRSGLVAKTDARGKNEIDEGLCVAICREGSGVNRVVSAGNYLWTATSSSSINRWADVRTEDAEVQLPESFSIYQRASVGTINRARLSSQPMMRQNSNGGESPRFTTPTPGRKSSTSLGGNQIPFANVLRLSNTAPFPIRRTRDVDTSTLYSTTSIRKPSEVPNDSEDLDTGVPVQNLPDFTIEGQHGLIKHVMLNDRRRVLTLDTAGEVTMWDLLKCIPVESFGKRHLEDVLSQVNTMETVAHWCAVDTRTGSLTCVLEENNCFDAELYADELQIEENIEFKEDQRINLGKWILRYLFDNLIDEEIRRDENFRRQLFEAKHPDVATERQQRGPGPIHIPPPSMTSWLDTSSTPNSASTLKPPNGFHPLQTPGFSIGVATPAPLPPQIPLNHANSLSPTAESAETGSARTSSERHSSDYFSARPSSATYPTTPGGPNLPVQNTPGAGRTSQEHAPDSAHALIATPLSPDSEAPPQSSEKSGLFGKKFMRMNFMPKGLKKTQPTEPKTPVPEEASSDAGSSGSRPEERAQEDNFLSAVLRVRASYHDESSRGKNLEKEISMLNMHSVLGGRGSLVPVASTITPSLPNDTPVLKPPPQTIILIQEDRVDSGGVADLWEGTVGNVGREADTVERVAPVWLADVLLRNLIPSKEIIKVSFVLEPWQGLLPPVSSEGNTRLNANRMLRAKKILSYVAERIEPMPEVLDPDALKAEDYLELYCQNQLVSPTMTLATIRAHVWRGGGDVLLFYKSNGRKPIAGVPQVAAGQTLI